MKFELYCLAVIISSKMNYFYLNVKYSQYEITHNFKKKCKNPDVACILIKNIFNMCKVKLTAKQKESVFEDLIPIFQQILLNCNEHFNCRPSLDTSIQKTPKSEVFEFITLKITKIVPMEFFGGCNNYRMFILFIKKIIYSSSYECIHNKYVLQGWDVKKIKILSIIKNTKVKIDILRLIVMWLLDKLVKQLIRSYFCVLKCIKLNQYDLLYIKKSTWQIWLSRILTTMIKKCDIQRINPLVIKKRIFCPQLIIRPKNKKLIGYRPIVNIDLRMNESKQKKLIDDIYNLIKLNSLSSTGNMHLIWKAFVENTDGKQIYGAVLDIKDAFGSVKIDRLLNVLQLRFSLIRPTSKTSFNRIRHLLKRPIIKLHTKKKSIIRNGERILKEKKTAKSHLYMWKHGLLQGVKISTPLCELYRCDFDIKYLTDLVNKSKPCILHRYLDDYFFVCTNKQSVEDFINIMTKEEKIKDKVFSNLPNYNDVELSFAGFIYNMNSKEVTKKLQLPKEDWKWKYYVNVWNQNYETWRNYNILKSIISIKRNHIHFKEVLFDAKINSIQKLFENFAKCMFIICVKLEVAITSLYRQKVNKNVCIAVINYILEYYSAIGYDKIINTEQSIDNSRCSKSLLCTNLKLIICEIFDLIFKRQAGGKYKKLAKYIKLKINSLKNSCQLPLLFVDVYQLKEQIFNLDD